MPPDMPAAVARQAPRSVRIVVDGRVQGVGFRPFINRLAVSRGLAGWVRNCAGRVEILASGPVAAVEDFLEGIVKQAPPLARPHIAEVRTAAASDLTGFTILSSEAGSEPAAELPPDHFVCDDCLAEMSDPSARRYRYPFINCTQCGPRYSIIRALPYDRPRTTMAEFELCAACRAEYSDPGDRRYHAQPLACPQCGPQLLFRQGSRDVTGNEAALAACVQAIRAGLTVAIKGVGGYHLVCDATRDPAVQRLRAAKRRPHKPFAVMLPMPIENRLAWAHRLASLDAVEAQQLASPVRPIVLVRRRDDAPLAHATAPGLADVGLMLPYSPLHHLLLQELGQPIVATSANVSGEPVLTDADEVERRLASSCDAYLHHDRPIHRPADDPVVRVIAGRAVPIRLGRGTAPLSLPLPGRLDRPVLACGAQLRSTVALGWRDLAVISPHVGDHGSPRTTRVFAAVAEGLQQLHGVRAARLACDLHPGFSTRAWASTTGLPITDIQHHHAHASALAGEHLATEPFLAFAWDGIGLGDDGTLWGGETLFGRPGHWRRVGTFRPLRLVGGDAVAHEPWRSAASIRWELGLSAKTSGVDLSLLRHAWERNIGTHPSSAAGRLFDAAAALLDVAQTVSYDGQAPATLEALARSPGVRIPLPIRESRDSDPWIVDWEPLFRALLEHRLDRRPGAELFHSTLAASIVDQARFARQRFVFSRVGLTGGVFQNRRLTEEAVDLLEGAGFEVLLHERVPPNDGGLSYGQLVESTARLAQESSNA